MRKYRILKLLTPLLTKLGFVIETRQLVDRMAVETRVFLWKFPRTYYRFFISDQELLKLYEALQ